MKRLAVFVSGGGTNLQRIAEYFAPNQDVEIACVVSNNKDAYANQRAKNLGIPLLLVEKTYFTGDLFVERMKSLDIDLIVLAGFLWLIPQRLIEAFPNKIINIHPALLPKYGGKGFYGHHVHEAVVAAHEKESGITVHYVNEHYDSGNIIFQAKVALSETDTPDDVAAKIHVLEQENFPLVIEKLLLAK
ncbi:MAG: phosphoribosylglycinamide formyltransferase [Bacteroidales bacterium]|jgi:phosphoribosylglycinamide formyltransferase-1|nr:phosphoribosylglycinamide formyltransferase [Bacteroidales bacterium]